MVETWPQGGWVVGLVPDPADPGWIGGAALALARVAAERRRPAFLLDLAPGSSDLDERFGAAGAEGFGEAVSGEVRLPEVAHRDDEHGIAYLPCGRRGGGKELGRSEALSAFAERVRGEGGVLLVILGREAAEGAASAGWADGWVLLGDAEAATGGRPLPGDLPELGRIEPREETGTDGSRRWRRHRENDSFPVLKVAAGALLLAMLAGAWWWYAERVTGGPNGPGSTDDVAATDLERPGPAAADTPETSDSVRSADTARRGGTAEDSVRGPPLEYSVLIASYASARDARERVRELSERSEGVFFVAPTPVRGTVWHRVYAGARADREAARALMETLVEAGAKGENRAWDVRPVPWAFLVAAALPSRARAEARAQELRRRGISAYVVPGGEGTAFHVYSGAFESRRAAGALGERMERDGVDAELVRRTGSPR